MSEIVDHVSVVLEYGVDEMGWKGSKAASSEAKGGKGCPSHDMAYPKFMKFASSSVCWEDMGLSAADVAMSVGRDRVTVPGLNIDDCNGVMTQKTSSITVPARDTAQCLDGGVSRMNSNKKKILSRSVPRLDRCDLLSAHGRDGYKRQKIEGILEKYRFICNGTRIFRKLEPRL
jgi:hypothetical protein